MQGGTLGLHVDLKPARFVVPFQRSAAFFVAVPFFAFGRLAAVCTRHADVELRLFADIIDFCTKRAVIKYFFGFSIRTAEKNGNAAAVAVAEHSHRTARAVALQFAIVEDIVGDAVSVEVGPFDSLLETVRPAAQKAAEAGQFLQFAVYGGGEFCAVNGLHQDCADEEEFFHGDTLCVGRFFQAV